jgi:hypothetical protein
MKIALPKRTKNLNIILCIPGNSFSAKFIQSYTALLTYCLNNGINLDIQQMFSSNVYHTRECMVASTVLSDSKNIVAFGGKDYDFSLWIDSDQVYTPQHLEILIARMADPNIHVVGASIKVHTGNEYAFGWFDEQLLKEKNELKRMTVAQMEGRKALIEVDYIGLAFTLVRKGVFESISFPWFEQLPYSVHECAKDKIGGMGEDLSWCYRIRKAGFKLYADPLVQVGHEKQVVL